MITHAQCIPTTSKSFLQDFVRCDKGCVFEETSYGALQTPDFLRTVSVSNTLGLVTAPFDRKRLPQELNTSRNKLHDILDLLTHLLTPRSRVLLEKLTSKLCS